MRLVTIEISGQSIGGVLNSRNQIVRLGRWGYESVLDVIERGPEALGSISASLDQTQPDFEVDDVELCAPIPRPPRNLFCVGANYPQHVAEGSGGTARQIPEELVLFTKPFTSLRGSRQEITFNSRVAQMLDWEAEVAVVIGKQGIDLGPEEAEAYVAGLCLANDISARDLQKRSGQWSQWFKGKSLDGSCPMGPYLTTIDEFGGHIPDVEFQLSINGTSKQKARTSQMIFSIPEIISDLSQGMELLPGDVVLTGTCDGIGLWQTPQHFLKHGDHIRIESPQLGLLTSTIFIRP